MYDLRARYYNPALGRLLSQDTYPVSFGNPVELNRYVYAANRPVNLSDPTGKAALIEYALTGALVGGLLGGASGATTAIACGESALGGFVSGALLGLAVGGAFGAAYAVLPGLTMGVGVGLGAAQAGVSVYDFFAHGMTVCQGVKAAWSLVFLALAVHGGMNYLADTYLGGLSDIGYPGELNNPNGMGHDGYYSDTGPINTGLPYPGFSLEESLFIRNALDNPETYDSCHFASLCGNVNSIPLYPDEFGRLDADPTFRLIGDLKGNMPTNDLRPGDLLTYYIDDGTMSGGSLKHSDRIYSIDGSNITVFDKPGPNPKLPYSLLDLMNVIAARNWSKILVFRR